MTPAPALENLEPKELWKHFAEIAKIPRASTKEDKVRQYVLGVAKGLGLEAKLDKVGNVVVRKAGRPGRENAPVVALQGHLDMVCEKNEATVHNFDTDPIRIVRKGEWLYADGTTLGADNGVGVAAGLAIMESTDLNHGPLEFVFTIDEETGLTGAAEFEAGMLKAKYMLNLDNEEKGTICIGCSGGINTTARRKVALKNPTGNAAYKIKVTGLKGGHSGVDIHLGRGNAIRILALVLQGVLETLPIEVADIKGGSARNVIPREATAIVVVDSAKEAELKKMIAKYEAEIQTDLGGFDPGLVITVETTEKTAKVLDAKDGATVVSVLASTPHGVLAMSPDIPGMVQNSTNLATISIKGEDVEIGSSQRSAIEASKQAAARLVSTVLRMAGFTVESTGSYPGWKPEPNSNIVQTSKQVHQEVFGKEPKLIAMHAGLECGVIGEKYPGMELISFGPQIESPHSPNERVEIESVADFYKYLRAVLERL